MGRVTGVWLDLDKAYIYHLQKGLNDFQIINSELEHFHSVGGSGSSTPYGPQDAVSEKKFLERKKHQTKDYFKRIAAHLSESREVLIIGPAEAKVGLSNYLAAIPNKAFGLHPILAKDSMTENQVKATIRDYFKQQKG